jgi:hypothetical protein
MKNSAHQWLFPATVVTIVVVICLAVILMKNFSREKVTVLDCKQGGNLMDKSGLLIWTCKNPNFAVTCSLRTYTKIDGVRTCISDSGTTYDLRGEY